MPDNPKKRGKADRQRVNIHQLHELRYWAKAFRCSQEAIVLARMVCQLRGWDPTGVPNMATVLHDIKNYVRAVHRTARKLARKRARK